jgi:dTDP-4-amino-4,6-dideoxygalactose transaminase
MTFRIPLMNPIVPPIETIAMIYAQAYVTGQHSNFGPLFDRAALFLSRESFRHCLPVSTGTAAIEIACRMQFIKGNRVLVPDYTHAGTLQAVVAAGCIPVLVETDPKTWTITEEIIIENSVNVSGVVAVSPFGYPVDFESIDRACQKTGLKAVYDFAGAWGQFPLTMNPVCYSLHATKNFSCGEGGIVSFGTVAEWEKARWLSNFCNDSDRVVRSLDGRNHKPSELLCAVILAHEEQYQNVVLSASVKKVVIEKYARELNLYAPSGGSPSLCVLEGITKEESKALNDMGIENKQYYPPFPPDICSTYGRTNLSLVLSRYALPTDGSEEVIECLKKIRRS